MSRPRNSSASCNTNQYACTWTCNYIGNTWSGYTFPALKLLPQGQVFFYTEEKFGLDLKYAKTLKRLS